MLLKRSTCLSSAVKKMENLGGAGSVLRLSVLLMGKHTTWGGLTHFVSCVIDTP